MNQIAEFLGPERVDRLTTIGLDWGLRLALALVLLVVGLWLARRVANGLRRALERSGQDAVLLDFVRNVAYGVLMAVLLVAVLQQVGVPTASLLAALGAIGLGIGLALKDSLANLAAGVLLIAFRPFRAGDFVEVSGQKGHVQQVRLFFTLLASPDNKEITIPNNEIATNPIINYTARTTRRVDLVLGVAYESEAARAIEVVRTALKRDSRVLATPEPVVMIDQLNESSVDLVVRPWVKTEDYWAVRGDLLRELKSALEAAGIDIPFPQRTVRIVGGTSAEREAAAAAGA